MARGVRPALCRYSSVAKTGMPIPSAALSAGYADKASGASQLLAYAMPA